MGAVEEIHERERKLLAVLGPRVIDYLRRREGGEQIEGPIEAAWGRVRFRVKLANAPITITLAIDP
jgi:hypothetical protein